jgi:hypothetical protein
MSFSLPWYFYWILSVLVALSVMSPLFKRLIQSWQDDRRYARAGLQEIKQMHWLDFEKYLAHLFENLGYQVHLTPPTNDYGVDLILTDQHGQQTAVQAKHWKGKRVGSPEVQQTIGAAMTYGCQHVRVVTILGYTDQAREVARKTGVQLWGLEELGDAVESMRARTAAGKFTAAVPATAIAGTHVSRPVRPTLPPSGRPAPTTKPTSPARPQLARVGGQSSPGCPTCASPMNLRAIQGRQVWLCSRSPVCKGFKFKD